MSTFDTETFIGSSLIIGDYPIHSEGVTISGGVALIAGAVLGTDGATFQLAEEGGAFAAPVAVLAVDADASGGNIDAPIHLSGKFDEALCNKHASYATWDAIRAALRVVAAPIFIVPLAK